MSENYRYTNCKHCGQSLMEGQIHSCRQMLLAEIADCHATMLRQAQQIDHWKEQAAIYKDQKQDEYEEAERWKKTALAQGEALAQYIIAKDRYKEALERILGMRLLNERTACDMQEAAREALDEHDDSCDCGACYDKAHLAALADRP